MTHRIILASFARPDDMLEAVKAVQRQSCRIIDVYTPYPVHGLEEVLGWPRSRLPAVCLLCGALGAGLALWFQFWTTARDWPLNVGGRPWNSLPAFVPVVFESMVLLAGFGLLFAWLWRCRLYPGKKAHVPLAGLADNRFVVVLRDEGLAVAPGAVQQLLRDLHAVALEVREEEEP